MALIAYSVLAILAITLLVVALALALDHFPGRHIRPK